MEKLSTITNTEGRPQKTWGDSQERSTCPPRKDSRQQDGLREHTMEEAQRIFRCNKDLSTEMTTPETPLRRAMGSFGRGKEVAAQALRMSIFRKQLIDQTMIPDCEAQGPKRRQKSTVPLTSDLLKRLGLNRADHGRAATHIHFVRRGQKHTDCNIRPSGIKQPLQEKASIGFMYHFDHSGLQQAWDCHYNTLVFKW
ncbi:hypothetical protein B0T21DRAFT_352386 [Apiosordaria backusii]|uniref:Uncharacterized protein n=1 Tax=Apiosordaria backusii TaxID=314023 RepID=A0AA40AAN0_9PEZI|nr:hypothetical protein B0T21DRAFT_352386 [Apiosordaria backusii]